MRCIRKHQNRDAISIKWPDATLSDSHYHFPRASALPQVVEKVGKHMVSGPNLTGEKSSMVMVAVDISPDIHTCFDSFANRAMIEFFPAGYNRPGLAS